MNDLELPARYQLMLPPGWVRLPLRMGTDHAIDHTLDQQFAQHPRDTISPLRRALREDLTTLAADARRTGAIDLYLMVDSPGEHPVDASLLVAIVDGPDTGDIGDTGETDDLAAVWGEGRATAVELRFSGAALRLVDEVPNEDIAAGALPWPGRRVHYLIPIPGGAGKRLLLTFATATGPVIDQLTTLFDAMAQTLGFSERAGDPA